MLCEHSGLLQESQAWRDGRVKYPGMGLGGVGCSGGFGGECSNLLLLLAFSITGRASLSIVATPFTLLPFHAPTTPAISLLALISHLLYLRKNKGRDIQIRVLEILVGWMGTEKMEAVQGGGAEPVWGGKIGMENPV